MKVTTKNKDIQPVKNKRQHTLLFFITLSTLFWLLIKLSNEYSSVVTYRVIYEKLPVEKLFQNDPPSTIDIRLKATGFKLLQEKINRKKLSFNLRKVFFKEKYHYYILTQNYKGRVQEQLGDGVLLQSFVKDTVFFELGLNKFKKVPVVSNIDVNCKLGFNISNGISLIPDSVVVRGPEIHIDKIKFIETEKEELLNVSENIDKSINLILPEELPKVTFSNEEVQLKARVEKFTEGSFEVPFEIVGIPDSLKITTYPKKVKVVFQIGLSNFSKISANSFKVQCDFKESKKRNLNYLEPKIIEKTSIVSSVKIRPSHIEYLIQK